MKHIFNAICWCLYKADTFLYNTFGYVSAIRRQVWEQQAESLQEELDTQHKKKDYNNFLHGTDFTTKQALKLK